MRALYGTARRRYVEFFADVRIGMESAIAIECQLHVIVYVR